MADIREVEVSDLAPDKTDEGFHGPVSTPTTRKIDDFLSAGAMPPPYEVYTPAAQSVPGYIRCASRVGGTMYYPHWMQAVYFHRHGVDVALLIPCFERYKAEKRFPSGPVVAYANRPLLLARYAMDQVAQDFLDGLGVQIKMALTEWLKHRY